MADIELIEIQRKGLWHGVRVQARVIAALLKRESVTRFSGRNFGMSLAFIEPLSYIVMFSIVHSYISTHIPFGESALLFFVSGLVVFRLYMSLASKTMSAITANQALLTYPMVKPLDTAIARIILESIVMICIGILVMTFVALYLDRDILISTASLAEGLVLTLLLGGSVGIFNAVVSALFTPWSTIYGMLGLPLFLSSGFLFLPAQLPPFALDIIIWNPVLHCVEIFRGAMYLDYLSVADPSYPLKFSVIALVSALFIERTYRTRLTSA